MTKWLPTLGIICKQMSSDKSFTNAKNKIGPSTLSCGTPPRIAPHGEAIFYLDILSAIKMQALFNFYSCFYDLMFMSLRSHLVYTQAGSVITRLKGTSPPKISVNIFWKMRCNPALWRFDVWCTIFLTKNVKKNINKDILGMMWCLLAWHGRSHLLENVLYQLKLYMYHAQSFSWQTFKINNITFTFQWGKIRAKKIEIIFWWKIYNRGTIICNQFISKY